ncbi:MAG: AraC-like DNA-binding protein [Halieaceae bacterium]
MSDRIKHPSDFNVVTDIFENLRFKGTIFFHSELAAPWGMSLERSEVSRFHIALDGDCYVGTNVDESVKLEHMEMVMLPRGNQHWIADQPGRELIESQHAGNACALGSPLFQEGDITNRLMCGLVSLDASVSHPIMESLPDIMHFPYQGVGSSAWATASMIDSEIQRTKNNTGPIIDRLTEVLFLQLLGVYLEDSTAERGFIAALRDPRLRRALKFIHQQPEASWSVDELGKVVGMSRATLNRQFQRTIGVSPISYIQNWKMIKAYNLVKYSSTSLESIAEQLGFSSAKTLTRAFLRHYSLTPAKLRKS